MFVLNDLDIAGEQLTPSDPVLRGFLWVRGRYTACDDRGMRKASHPYTCHWGYIDGPSREGQPVRQLMWVCEYPYRTLRASGPDEDCVGCPGKPQLSEAELVAAERHAAK